VPGADVDYTFAQVQVKDAKVDYSGNCGNMSSAMGPFAYDEKLVDATRTGEAQVRIHNTNTRKIIRSTFGVREGRSIDEGTLVIPGVHGTGAPVRLDFIEPGGASTGRLLPTGAVVDELAVPADGLRVAALLTAAGLTGSNSEASRKLKERAVRVDGEVVEDPQRLFSPGFEGVLQVGKRNFARIALAALRMPRISVIKLFDANTGIYALNALHVLRDPVWVERLTKSMTTVDEMNLKPHVGKVFDANDVASAHAFLETKQATGKVLLAWN
jgi:hypothetical protein